MATDSKVTEISSTKNPTIEDLLKRIESLEADRERFMNAMRGAAKMALDNTMVCAMLPKQMKNDLKTYLESTPEIK